MFHSVHCDTNHSFSSHTCLRLGEKQVIEQVNEYRTSHNFSYLPQLNKYSKLQIERHCFPLENDFSTTKFPL